MQMFASETRAIPVHCIWQHAEAVRILLGAYADVNAADEDGYTPLYLSAQRGCGHAAGC
jgi:hypothetical protein